MIFFVTVKKKFLLKILFCLDFDLNPCARHVWQLVWQLQELYPEFRNHFLTII